MSNPEPHSDSEETREFILDAAQARLLRFGYHKTTMAEIAQDTGMSAANLYRYFKNKQDIVAECTVRCLHERLDRLQRIVRDPACTPSEKLRRYARELVDDSHALAGVDSMVGELVDAVTRERPDVLHAHNEFHFALLGEILEAGVTAAEFAPMDVESTACAIFSAFTLFEVPLFVGFYSRDEFDRRADGVVDLILNGLRQSPRA